MNFYFFLKCTKKITMYSLRSMSCTTFKKVLTKKKTSSKTSLFKQFILSKLILKQALRNHRKKRTSHLVSLYF